MSILESCQDIIFNLVNSNGNTYRELNRLKQNGFLLPEEAVLVNMHVVIEKLNRQLDKMCQTSLLV